MSSSAPIPAIDISALQQDAAKRASVADIATLRPRADFAERVTVKLGAAPKQRTRIWDLHTSLHCSIIGTCLTSAELRRLLIRLKVAGADAADDHDLHMMGVLLAARPHAGGKHLQKTLDRRHGVALDQFAKAKSTDAVALLWQDARRRGDVPGAYWALLTHPMTSDVMVKRAFGEVHMLSHLVGAANRADIRRLCALEAENAALGAKLERQQRHLRDGFTTRDETIRRLTAALAQAKTDRVPVAENAQIEFAAGIAERDAHLNDERARRHRLEQRVADLTEERDAARGVLAVAERECGALRAELAALEIQIAALLQQDEPQGGEGLDLKGLAVLYVGGRARLTPQLKTFVERANGRFLHHDGGLEQNAALLPGLVSRADLAVFPVDCVSHDAVAALKRACAQLGKPFVALRTASLACLISALAALPHGAAVAPL